MKPNQSKKTAKRSKLEPERDQWAVPDSLLKPLYKTISTTEASDESKPAGKRTNFSNGVNKHKAAKAINQAKRNRFK